MKKLTTSICLMLALIVSVSGCTKEPVKSVKSSYVFDTKAWNNSCARQMLLYAGSMSRFAMENPIGARQISQPLSFYLSLEERIRNRFDFENPADEAKCAFHRSRYRQNWNFRVQGIFPKLKKTKKPFNAAGSRDDTCNSAFAIIEVMANKGKTQKERFAALMWAANTQLVEAKECQWIVDAYD